VNPFHDDAAGADECSIFHDDGLRLRRLEHAADADPARQVHVLADLRARTDRRPRIDHRVFVDVGADVHVPGHQDRAPPEKRAVARDARRHAACSEFLVIGLRRKLIEVAEAVWIAHDAVVVTPERQQDRDLDPGVGLPSAVRRLADPQPPRVERRQDLIDGRAVRTANVAAGLQRFDPGA
jgi:hypothetical protein